MVTWIPHASDPGGANTTHRYLRLLRITDLTPSLWDPKAVRNAWYAMR